MAQEQDTRTAQDQHIGRRKPSALQPSRPIRPIVRPATAQSTGRYPTAVEAVEIGAKGRSQGVGQVGSRTGRPNTTRPGMSATATRRSIGARPTEVTGTEGVRPSSARYASRGDINRGFPEIDANRDGVLSQKEYNQGIAKAVLRQVDRDGNGLIDEAKFLNSRLIPD